MVQLLKVGRFFHCLLSSAPCFREMAGRMEPVLVSPDSAKEDTGRRTENPAQDREPGTVEPRRVLLGETLSFSVRLIEPEV